MTTTGHELVVTSTQRFFIGGCLALFPLIVGCAPVGTGVIRAAWVLVFLGLAVFAFVRACRMHVLASERGVVVQNLGRCYAVPWVSIKSLDVEPSDNVTGLVKTIYVRRTDGRDVVARIASSYSRPKVERWRDQLLRARPSSA